MMSNLKNQNAIIKNIKSIWSNPKKRTKFLQIFLSILLGLSVIFLITNDITLSIGVGFTIMIIL